MPLHGVLVLLLLLLLLLTSRRLLMRRLLLPLVDVVRVLVRCGRLLLSLRLLLLLHPLVLRPPVLEPDLHLWTETDAVRVRHTVQRIDSTTVLLSYIYRKDNIDKVWLSYNNAIFCLRWKCPFWSSLSSSNRSIFYFIFIFLKTRMTVLL